MIWIVRFLPARGGPGMDASFQDAASAQKVYTNMTRIKRGEKDSEQVVEFADSFSVRMCIDLRDYSIIKTDSEVSAQFGKALHDANQEAQSNLNLMDMKGMSVPGSSLQ